MSLRGAGFIVLLMIAPAAAFAAEPVTCTPGGGPATHRFNGEVAGANGHLQNLGEVNGFYLAPSAYGWEIKLFDASGLDVAQYTPPYRFGPNDREIYGWHFRNADNSGSNDGSVNAPQTLRRFYIAPDLAVRGVDPMSVDMTDPAVAAQHGSGTLTILDYGLADLEPGQQARMVYLKFEVCLSWPESTAYAELAEITPEEAAIFDACGLGAPLALDSYLAPHFMRGDYDGDGVPDFAATVSRETDGKRGIAVCLGGTRLDMIGLDEAVGELTPGYFDLMTYWYRRPEESQSDRDANRGFNFGGRAGDTITVGIAETSSVLLYWSEGALRSLWLGD